MRGLWQLTAYASVTGVTAERGRLPQPGDPADPFRLVPRLLDDGVPGPRIARSTGPGATAPSGWAHRDRKAGGRQVTDWEIANEDR